MPSEFIIKNKIPWNILDLLQIFLSIYHHFQTNIFVFFLHQWKYKKQESIPVEWVSPAIVDVTGEGGASFLGVLPSQGGFLPGGVHHVTYAIMHLMLPVCCLLTNWDPPTVQLLIYCWLVMWPARHPGIPTPPWTEFLTYASENITLPQTSFAGSKNHRCSL